MTFKPSIFDSLFETHEDEQARLASSPVGSINHYMSQLPVVITGDLQDKMIELPATCEPEFHKTIVVVPFERSAEPKHDREHTPWRRNDGYWRCLVIASDHTSYPVGGYRIDVSESQLVRGTIRTLAPLEVRVEAEAVSA